MSEQVRIAISEEQDNMHNELKKTQSNLKKLTKNFNDMEDKIAYKKEFV